MLFSNNENILEELHLSDIEFSLETVNKSKEKQQQQQIFFLVFLFFIIIIM